MNTISSTALEVILADHSKWLLGKGGQRANLKDVKIYDYDLSNHDLSRIHMSNVVLFGVNLTDTNLTSAKLRDVECSSNDLIRTNLTDAKLTSVNLNFTDLTNANLTNATLTDMSINNADFDNATLTNIKLNNVSMWNANGNGKEIRTYTYNPYFVTIAGDVIQIGCERHLADEWANMTNQQIFDMDGHIATAFWEAYKNDILKLVDLPQ